MEGGVVTQRELIFDAPLVESDLPELNEQLRAVAEIMRRGDWYTIAELRQLLSYRGIAASEAGVSARIRDLRKPPLNWTVERKRVGNRVFGYRKAK